MPVDPFEYVGQYPGAGRSEWPRLRRDPRKDPYRAGSGDLRLQETNGRISDFKRARPKNSRMARCVMLLNGITAYPAHADYIYKISVGGE